MRILLAAIYCLVGLTLATVDRLAFSQDRLAEPSSQRILPLPDSHLSDSQTQMQLLKRLQSLVTADADGKNDSLPNRDDSQKFDEQQLDQLQQALKKLQDQLPLGIKPPELDSIPQEQLDQAMSNPAVQQQLKKMLEQFSKDGLLPKTEDGGDTSQRPPIPRTNNQLPKPAEPRSPFDPPSSLEPRFPVEPETARQKDSQGQQDTPQPDPNEPLPKPGEKSWQSLKEAMRKLADIAQGQKKSPQDSPQNNSDGDSADRSDMPTSPGGAPKRQPDKSATSPENPPSGRPGTSPLRPNPGSPQPEISPPNGSGGNRASDLPPRNDNGSGSQDGNPSPTNPSQTIPPQTNPSQTGEPEPEDSDKKKQSLKTLQDLLERFKNSQRDQTNGINDERTSPPINSDDLPVGKATGDSQMSPETDSAAQRSQNQNPSGAQSSPSSDPSKRVLRRPDRSTPVIPPGSTMPRSSQQGEVFPPAPVPQRDSMPRDLPSPQNSGPSQRSGASRSPSERSALDSSSGTERGHEPNSPQSSDSSNGGLFPSVSEFIKDQIKKGLTDPASEDRVAKSNTSPQNNRTRDMNPGSPQSRGAGRGNSPGQEPGNSSNARRNDARSVVPGFDKNSLPPDLDVQKELESRGLRGTFEKIVQNAKEETRARQQQESIAGQPGIMPGSQDRSVVPANPSGGSPTPNDPGMQESLGDLLSGLDDSMQDIAKDAKFKTPPVETQPSRDASPQSPSANSESSLGKIRDAASGFFSDLSKAPQAPALTPSNSGTSGGNALSADAPLAIGSFVFLACALIGVGGLVAYLMRKPLMKLVTDATGGARVQPVLKPSEIQTRSDVIAAFHDLALSPRQAVESWWTHRAAAQSLAAESPKSRHAVDTLAEIYEQARYLPDDVELPADKIQSARTALAECR